jgi:ABC-type spermidine/putrescine transport system permease subunit II
MVFEVVIEGIVVGVLTTVLGIMIGFLLYKMINNKKNIAEITSSSHYVPIIISLFITGFAFHILCEIFGINAWYCKERFPKTRKM